MTKGQSHRSVIQGIIEHKKTKELKREKRKTGEKAYIKDIKQKFDPNNHLKGYTEPLRL